MPSFDGRLPETTTDPAAVALFGVEDGESIAGFIHVGSLTEPPLERPRPNLEHKVTARP